MSIHARLASLLRNTLRRRRVEQDLDDEVRSYIDMVADEKRADGFSDDAARRAALLEVQGVEQLKESVRDVRAGGTIEQFRRDLSYGLRVLFRHRGFTATAVATLALGIGVSTATFSIVDRVVFRPLPYKNPARLVKIWGTTPKSHSVDISLRDLLDIRSGHSAFEQIAADDGRDFEVVVAGARERVLGALVTADWLSTLGVTPVLGRGDERSSSCLTDATPQTCDDTAPAYAAASATVAMVDPSVCVRSNRRPPDRELASARLATNSVFHPRSGPRSKGAFLLRPSMKADSLGSIGCGVARVEVRMPRRRPRHGELRLFDLSAAIVARAAPQASRNGSEVSDEFTDVDPTLGADQFEAVVVSGAVDARSPEVCDRAIGPRAERVDDIRALASAVVVVRCVEPQRLDSAGQLESVYAHGLEDEMNRHVGRDAAAPVADRRRILVLQDVMRLLERADAAAREPVQGDQGRGVEVPLKPDLHESIRPLAKSSAEFGGFGNRVGDRFLDKHWRAKADEGQTVARVVLRA